MDFRCVWEFGLIGFFEGLDEVRDGEGRIFVVSLSIWMDCGVIYRRNMFIYNGFRCV